MAQLLRPFSPIAPGEVDKLAFDFAADLGAAEIVSTTWTCALAPLQTGIDPDPQAHILSVEQAGEVEQEPPFPGGVLRTDVGKFSVAQVGGFPPSADGSWYVLEATIVTNDGRTLKLSSAVLCSSTAPAG